MLPSCPYKPLSLQTLRYPQFLSNFQSPKFKFSVSRKKNVRLFGVMTKTKTYHKIGHYYWTFPWRSRGLAICLKTKRLEKTWRKFPRQNKPNQKLCARRGFRSLQNCFFDCQKMCLIFLYDSISNLLFLFFRYKILGFHFEFWIISWQICGKSRYLTLIGMSSDS